MQLPDREKVQEPRRGRSVHILIAGCCCATGGYAGAREDADTDRNPETDLSDDLPDVGQCLQARPEAAGGNRVQFFDGKLAVRKLVVGKGHLVFLC